METDQPKSDPLNAASIQLAQAAGLAWWTHLPDDIILPELSDTQVSFCLRHQILPIERQDGHAYAGLAHIDALTHLDELRFMTGVHYQPVCMPSHILCPALEKWAHRMDGESLCSLLRDNTQPQQSNLATNPNQISQLEQNNAQESPVIRYINNLLREAHQRGASDIHLEPQLGGFQLRLRIDGLLQIYPTPESLSIEQLVSRLKVMARLDIAEHRLPQDGRMQLNLGTDRVIDIRVSVMPTLYGEKVVLRLLQHASAIPSLEALGLEPNQYECLCACLAFTQGLILITGPTGSGKTMSLYAMIAYLSKSEISITTVEDPVEIALKGINQVQIQPRIGLDFATALKSILRQDPDLIMIGEIRDQETAEIAVKASQTGHLVLATLHTNDAVSAIHRLLNMGVQPWHLAGALRLIVAQRLLRQTCLHCGQKEQSEQQLENQQIAEPIKFFGATKAEKSCGECYQGYRGRIGVFEVLPVSSALISMMLTGAKLAELRAQIRKEGVHSLQQTGLIKVQKGLTDYAELMRVCGNTDDAI